MFFLFEKPAKTKLTLLWVATVLVLLLVFAVTALTYEGEYRWLGHAIAAIAGLVLIVIVIVNGASLTGRLKRGTINAYMLHKNVSVLFTLFMLGTFLFGLWIQYSHGEALLASIHGWIGLVIVVLALIQVVPCFVTKQRSKVRFLHMVAGFAVAVLVVIQVAWGLEIAVVDEVKDLVLIHSTFGAIAALALTWLIVEMRNLTPKGLTRGKYAAFIATFFNIVGCWFAGGYYYLTVYASQLKPIIVGGTQPWAHRVVMETKEHVFLFLPVVTLTLLLMLVWLGKDQLLFEDSKARNAVIALAVFALAMVMVTFVFGALISNAANIVGGGE